ncbi:MAG: hypothetical protein R3E83_11270 [Burkholderiaceae bacterium]
MKAGPGRVDAKAAAPASCEGASSSGWAWQTLVTPDSPVKVPEHFLGMHVSLHIPAWKRGGRGRIPPPTYPYGYVRTMKVEVDGLEERGFWSNIEFAPGKYDWRYMDAWMEATAGHPVIWLIFGMPGFYQLYPDEPTRWPSWHGIASPPNEAGHAALIRYMRAVKARYGERIAAFEAWGEPTFPWTAGATAYDDRWTPAWGKEHLPDAPQPFFSGSASDLANIVYTMKQADLGVPILASGFADQWKPDQHSVTRFLNAPVTLPGGSGRGGDHIDALSVHFYDYKRKPSELIDVIEGYRAKLAASDWPSLPMWLSEVGAGERGSFRANEPAAATALMRWAMLGAALGMQSTLFYGHVSPPDNVTSLGDPIRGENTIAALREAARLNGATICRAALLWDGRVSLSLAGGETLVR